LAKTLLLARHELRLMRNELKFSLKRSITSIFIVEVVIMVIATHIALAMILFLIFDASPDVGAQVISLLGSLGLTTSGMSEVFYYLGILFVVSSFLTGLLSSSFGSLFTRVDENVIIASPASPHALFIAKRFKRFLTHVMMVALLLLALYPVVTRIGFQGFQLLLLYVTILAFLEIYGLIENISYSLSRGLMMARSVRQTVALASAFGLLAYFVLLFPFIILLNGNSVLADLYPPYLLGQILTSSLLVDRNFGASLLAIEAIIFLIVASMTARFGLKRWASSPRFVQTRGSFIPLRKNMLVWKGTQKNSIRPIFMKDFWTTIRIPAKFLVPLVITVILLILAVQVQIVFPSSLTNPSVLRYADPVFLLSTYLISVFFLPPAWDSFASEKRTIFLLKTLPISSKSIVRGKYLFAVLKSVLYITPIIGTMSILLPHSTTLPLVALQVTLVLLVSNALGVLASVSYPSTYRGMGPPPLLVVFGLPLLCTFLTVIIPILLTLSYGSTMSFVYSSVILLIYVFLVLRFSLRKTEESFVRLQEF
jgi:hypothetical protein